MADPTDALQREMAELREQALKLEQELTEVRAAYQERHQRWEQIRAQEFISQLESTRRGVVRWRRYRVEEGCDLNEWLEDDKIIETELPEALFQARELKLFSKAGGSDWDQAEYDYDHGKLMLESETKYLNTAMVQAFRPQMEQIWFQKSTGDPRRSLLEPELLICYYSH